MSTENDVVKAGAENDLPETTVLYAPDGSIKGATLETLVEKLTSNELCMSGESQC